MKTTQVYLENNIHDEVVRNVNLLKSKGVYMTNREYIAIAVKEKLKRDKEKNNA